MFGWIKRMKNKGKLLYDSDWESLNNEELVSLLVTEVGENEVKRLTSILDRVEEERAFSTLKRITFTEGNNGVLYFNNSKEPLFFFGETI